MNNLSLIIGLSEEQNASVPSDYSSSNPLSKSSEYWLAWNSYIFVKFEGFFDADGDGEPETGFNLHLGSDAASRPIARNSDDSDGEISLIIDLMDVFDNGQIYDIRTNPNIHSLEQMPLAEFLMDNLASSLRLED